MRNRRIGWLVSVVVLAAACRGDIPLATAPVPDSGVRQNLTASESQAYVDAWRAAGSPVSEKPTVTLASAFNGSLTFFNADGQVLFNYYSNDNSAVLKAWLIDESGSTVNSNQAEVGNANLLPFGVPQSWHSLNTSVSTINRNCGLVGKADIRGHSALKEATPFGVVELWRDPILKTVADKPLGTCPEQTECNGYIVEDPSTCADYANGGGEGGSGGGTGGGGGGGGNCELWRFELRRSYDGGYTWETVQVWYEWVGC